MNKHLLRAVALLLVPCLIADSLVASSLSNPVTHRSSDFATARLCEEALATPAATFAHKLGVRYPFLSQQVAAAPPFRKTLLWRTAYFALRHLVNLYAQYPNKILYTAISKMVLPFLGRLSLGDWDPERFYAFRLDRLRVWGGFDRDLLLERDYDPVNKGYVEYKPPKLIRNNSIDIRAAKFGKDIMAGIAYRPAASIEEFMDALQRKLREESSDLALEPNNEKAFFTQGANLVDAMRQLLEKQRIAAPVPVRTLTELSAAWKAKLEDSRRLWKPSSYGFPYNPAAPFAFDPSDLKTTPVGPFVMLELPAFSDDKQAGQGANAEKDPNVLEHDDPTILGSDPSGDFYLTTCQWPDVPGRSQLWAKTKVPQGLTPNLIASQLAWAQRGAVLQFHSTIENKVGHQHSHLYPASAVPVSRFANAFEASPHHTHSGVAMGALRGWPLPHIALAGSDMKSLDDAVYQLASQLISEAIMFRYTVMPSSQAGEVIVNFTLWKGTRYDDKAAPFRFDPVGIVRPREMGGNPPTIQSVVEALRPVIFDVSAVAREKQLFWTRWSTPATTTHDLSDPSKQRLPRGPNGAVIEPLPLAHFTPEGLKGALAAVQAKQAPEHPAFIELRCRNVSEIAQFDHAFADPKLYETIQQVLSHSDVSLVVIVKQEDLQAIKFEHFHLLPPDHPIVLAPIGEPDDLSLPLPERPEAFSEPQADEIRKWLSQASERLETVAGHWQEEGVVLSVEKLLLPFEVVSDDIRRALRMTWTERGRAAWESRAKGHLALSELLELFTQGVLPTVREDPIKTDGRDITRYYFEFASQTSEKNVKAKLSIRHETAAPRIVIWILSRKEEGHDWAVVYRMGADRASEEAYPIALPQLLHVDVNSSYRIRWQHKLPLTAAFSESLDRNDALASFFKFSAHVMARLKTASTIPDGEIEDSWRAKEIAGAIAKELHLDEKNIKVSGEVISSPKEFAFPFPQIVVQNLGKPIARLLYQIDREIPSGTGLSIFPRQMVMDASVPQASVQKVAVYLQAYALLRHNAHTYYASAADLPYARELERAGLVELIANPSEWAKDAGFPGTWYRVRQDQLMRYVEGDPFHAALGVVQGLGGESDGRHFLELAHHFELVHRALRWFGLPSGSDLRQEFVTAFTTLTKTSEYRYGLSAFLGDYKGATTEEKKLASYIAALDANPTAAPVSSAVRIPAAARRAA